MPADRAFSMGDFGPSKEQSGDAIKGCGKRAFEKKTVNKSPWDLALVTRLWPIPRKKEFGPGGTAAGPMRERLRRPKLRSEARGERSAPCGAHVAFRGTHAYIKDRGGCFCSDPATNLLTQFCPLQGVASDSSL